MLNIHIHNDRQNQLYRHEAGPLELGRGPRRQAQRIIVEDHFVSRNHLAVEELANGKLWIENLSQRQAIPLPNGVPLACGANRECDLPLRLEIGKSIVKIERVAAEPVDEESYQTLAHPIRQPADRPMNLRDLGESPTPEKIASWLETVLALQRSSATAREFYDQTARALVELIGLDLGMVLLRRRHDWEVAGHYTTNDAISSRYSRTLLERVTTERQTFFQDLKDAGLQADSLRNIDAVVVSPFFGLQEELAGVLYGMRTWRGGGIRPLEAQLVQLLAGALGANLTRTTAMRSRLQFEQFFSAELARELEHDSSLLEGRRQDVTILFSDVRGFTALAERLGPEITCRVIRDIIARLSEQITNHGGTIVNYLGDGILAMWNAPVLQPDHAVRACRAALAMLGQLPALNETWQATIGHALTIGIGINSGPALVGNTGSDRRLQYGPFGLTVNLASRIESATKTLGVSLLVSASVHEQVRKFIRTRLVGPVPLAGVSGEVPLYELCGEMTTLLPNS